MGVTVPVGKLVREGDSVDVGVELPLTERLGEAEYDEEEHVDTEGVLDDENVEEPVPQDVKDSLTVGQGEEDVLGEELGVEDKHLEVVADIVEDEEGHPETVGVVEEEKDIDTVPLDDNDALFVGKEDDDVEGVLLGDTEAQPDTEVDCVDDVEGQKETDEDEEIEAEVERELRGE